MNPETDSTLTPPDAELAVPNHFETNHLDSTIELLNNFELVTDKSITPREILELRGDTVSRENEAVWEKCLAQSMFVIGVRHRSDNNLVGIAMLSGNQRHAELVDLTVHPDYQKSGLGGILVDEVTSFAEQENIKYYGLTWDKTQPWLKEFYLRHGFRAIDFAMWHENSLDK
jgi:N-acetylglutamate synthase-like GNAT family acetyltransferase